MAVKIKNPHTEARHELLRKHEAKQIDDSEFEELYAELVAREKDFLDQKLLELNEKIIGAGVKVEEIKENETEFSPMKLLREMRVLYRLSVAYMKQTRSLKKELRELIQLRKKRTG